MNEIVSFLKIAALPHLDRQPGSDSPARGFHRFPNSPGAARNMAAQPRSGQPVNRLTQSA
ncbi:MAG: hypothetical protein KME26_00690 [Oscillatoria princeps RMCB-10]|nr:hypothetical protein [Oscillatoria princeps RMCB-10]